MDRNFLDLYFQAVHDKLEADALLFNRQLPHAGLAGAENEKAIADVIRDFLPRRYGIDVSALVIDKHGNVSRQCDIVIYDNERFPKYFRKVFPVELVYAVIEVKTVLSSQKSAEAIGVLRSVNQLDFRPLLTNYWRTRTNEDKLLHYPPLCGVFGYRSDADAFETFARWFPWDLLHEERRAEYPEIRSYLVGALDQGIIRMESTNGHVRRWMAEASAERHGRALLKRAYDKPVHVDPAKSLLFFLEQLWVLLSSHPLHPGFDIRSYMGEELGTFIEITNERIYQQ